ncbi:MAG: Uma2 family endonuclease [SAR324 cluster bacterium]|nr:Uma2 family endonuclease [SAR324 cluster bacterium]
MNWLEVCNDPCLQDLPYKIELNRDGDIVMSPVRVRHSVYVRRIQVLLEKLLLHGICPPEFPVMTVDNVKSPDVVWISDELFEQVKEEEASPVAPEICIEVKSPSNSWTKMLNKAALYFEKGAKEVWICDEQGNMSFFDPEDKLPTSRMVPDFPQYIEY